MLRDRRSLTNNSLRRNTKTDEELLQRNSSINYEEPKQINNLTVASQIKRGTSA